MASEALARGGKSSASDESIGFLEHAGDRANAILVKEVRQALKSRSFVAAFMLLLTGAWLISIFGMLFAGSQVEYGSTGRGFFLWFYVVLTVAAVMVVPFGTYRSLLNERDLDTFELLHITTLRPRQIVWGKLLCALVQLFIFYAAIMPFVAFASLLQGFDASRALFFLVFLFCESMILSMVALTISTFTEKRIFHWLSSMVVLGGLGGALIATLSGTIWAMNTDRPPLDDPTTWWIVLFIAIAAASYFALFMQVAISRLTFETGNRSSGIRIVAQIQFLLFWGCYWTAIAVFSPRGNDHYYVMLAGSALHWGVLGWFFCAESGFLSRRVRRDLPKSKILRLIFTPFLPGGSRGYLLILLNMAAFWWLMVFAMGYGYASGGGAFDRVQLKEFVANAVSFELTLWPPALKMVTWLCAYISIFLGFMAMIAHWGGIWFREIKPAHLRMVVLLLMAACVITPHLLRLADVIVLPRRSYHLIFVLDPISTLNHLGRRVPSGMESEIIGITLTFAVLVLLANIPVLIQGTRYILKSNLKSRSHHVENA